MHTGKVNQKRQHCIVGCLEDSIERKELYLTIFLDIEEAFNNVNLHDEMCEH